MKKNHNRLWIVTFVCLCLCLTSTISAMQMGGFDIDVGNGESSSWQWQEQQQWNQSSWENTWENNLISIIGVCNQLSRLKARHRLT